MSQPPDLLCLAHLRWDFVYQRPQHLMSRFARDRRVFYFEEVVYDDRDPWLEVRDTAEGVRVAVPHVREGLGLQELDEAQRLLLDEFRNRYGIERFALWYYTPMAVAFSRHLRPLVTVWDCMDELSAFQGADPTLRDREGELLDSADVIFTGGRSLYEAKRGKHSNVHLFPSAVDHAHFATARRPQDDPQDQAAIPRPRIGFFGVIDERMDLDLLAGVAAARPDWHLVLVGPVVKIDPAALPAAPNIHYLGRRAYEELPAYLAGWDVAMLPFAHNEATRFISPTKTPEYLAAGKPVVSTSIRDVVSTFAEHGLVHVADDPAGFFRAVERAMAEDPEERQAKADPILAEMSWDVTAAAMSGAIQEIADGREAAGGLPRAAPSGEGPANGEAPANGHAEVIALDDRLEIAVTPRGFDYLVVGAGYAGAITAERLASAGRRVLVVEKRNHIAGNAHDRYDDHGILIHQYGPHIFHTNSREVFEYLSRFTAWRRYEHRVLASVDGQLVPLPINLDTINRLYGLNLTSFEVEEFLRSVAEPVEHVKTSEDVVVGRVGRALYEKFFRGYTRKQWGLDPSELDASVTSRVPTRTNRDDRYFTDAYQAMPAHGYTRMFERILDRPNIKLMLNTDYREVQALIPYREMVYTGPIDEFFGYRYGRLPYRSLDFRFETLDVPVAQPAPVVNYPNEHPYTRTTEFKYLTGQQHAKTTIVYEHPTDEGDPYYPVPRPENAELYKRYKALAEETRGVHFVGRLATYKYYNMDQVAAQALAVAKRLLAAPWAERPEEEGSVDAAVAARALGRDRVHP